MEFSTLQNQEQLLAKLKTPFGESDVVLKSLDGREELFELFEFTAVFEAKDSDLDLEKALGGDVSISIKSETMERNISGIVAAFSQGATEKKEDLYLTEYTVVIRPKLWLLSLDNNCLIFQKKSIIDIITQVLKDCGITDVEDKTRSCGKIEREYCVQFNESSYNFVKRLMEDAGIFFFFKHEKNKHVLVLADSSSAHEKVQGDSKIEFIRSSNDVCPLGKIFATRMTASVNTGSYSAADYNYTISQTKLHSSVDGKWKGKKFYEYPGKFEKIKDGDDVSKLRVQIFEFPHCLLYGGSTSPNLTPGFAFEMSEHHVKKFNKEFVVRSVQHFYKSSPRDGFVYRNDFCAFEKGVEFRPERKTPKPRIFSTQTAIVVCPSGEEIFRNEHGCVKVHFHWDQIGKSKDADDSSCWIRVAQTLAGSGWGALFIPRVGQEVVVSFVDGDPDRPIIVGCVYNDKYLPAYPDSEAMKSSLKTVTFKDEKGFNEFRFNDEKDKEEIFIHAQKDMYVSIINSRKTEIEEADDTLDIFKGSRSVTLQAKGDNPANYSLLLKKGDRSVELTEGNSKFTITKGNEEIILTEGDRTITLSKGNMVCDVTGDYTMKISGNLSIKADGDVSIESGKSITLKSGAEMTLKSGKNLSVETSTDVKMKSGTAMAMQSGTDMSVKAGMAFSGQSTMGMTLKAGLNFDASATMNMSLKANMMLETNGMITAKYAGTLVNLMGNGAVNIKGAMVAVGALVKLG